MGTAMHSILKVMILSMVTAFLFAGCAGFEKQKKINNFMMSHTFQESPDKVMEAAMKVYEEQNIRPLVKSGDNMAARKWLTEDKTIGGVGNSAEGKKYKQKTRYTCSTSKAAGGTKLVCNMESQSTLGEMDGKFGDVMVVRQAHDEFKILKVLNPAKAAEVEKMASAK